MVWVKIWMTRKSQSQESLEMAHFRQGEHQVQRYGGGDILHTFKGHKEGQWGWSKWAKERVSGMI